MTPFALVFMTVSMTAVTVLAGWCMYRILGGGSRKRSNSEDSEDG